MGLEKPSVWSTVELEITEGSRYRGVEKPRVWCTVEVERTDGSRNQEFQDTMGSE